MNINEENANYPVYRGTNNDYGPALEELRNVYVNAGLPPGIALEAALADAADLFKVAA